MAEVVKDLLSKKDVSERSSLTLKQLEYLWSKGKGPKRVYLGTRVMVTAKAFDEWIETLNHPDKKAQKEQAAIAEKLKAKASSGAVAFWEKRREEA